MALMITTPIRKSPGTLYAKSLLPVTSSRFGCPSPDEINRIAEAKASRDVLVHNCGVASKTYESKAGRLARHEEGHRIDIPEHYHRQTWELLRKVVMDISNQPSRRLDEY